MGRILVVLFLLAASVRGHAEGPRVLCRHHISAPREVATELSRETAAVVQSELGRQGLSAREARGYAILVSVMVVSLAGTNYLTSSLPSGFQFLSGFLAQVSTLGFVVLGAPIWEPLSYRFRKFGFSVHQAEHTAPDPNRTRMWKRTQNIYSLDAQMSRNTLGQARISVQANFHEARRAMENDRRVAVHLVAEAAYWLRHEYREIEPDEASLALLFRSAFTNHVPAGADFIRDVKARLRDLDPDDSSDDYDRLLAAWL